MKKLVSVALVGVMLVTTASSALYAAPKNSNAIQNRNRNQVEVVKQEENVVQDVRETLRIMVEYSDGTLMHLPPGLAKRGADNLPPGLQKQLERGRFPFGLTHGKPQGDDQESIKLAIEKALNTLEARIAVAEDRLDSSDKNYMKALENAVKRAQSFLDNYKNENLKAIQAETNLLNEAIKVFDDNETYGHAYLKKLVDLKAELEAYKSRYFPKDASEYANDSHYKALIELITRIEGYIKEGSEQILTKGTYDEIIKEAKMFGDHLIKLEKLIDKALETLYEDPKAATLTYKHQEGILPGMVISGSRQALKTAIEAAQSFIKDYETFNHDQILNAENNLKKAIATYEGNMVLGLEDKEVLSEVLLLLKAHQNESPPDALSNLINEIEDYAKDEAVLTRSRFNDLLDESKNYITDLYKYTVALLESMIKEGKDFLALEIEHYVDQDLVNALETAVETAKKYVEDENDMKYAELNTLYKDLKKALTAIDQEMESLLGILEVEARAIVEENDQDLEEYLQILMNDLKVAKSNATKYLKESNRDYVAMHTLYEALLEAKDAFEEAIGTTETED